MRQGSKRRDGLSLVLAALAVAATLALAAGLALGAKSFLSNLLAELTGFAVSVIVAVLLIDRLAERRRRQRWATVRDHTLRTISVHLIDMGVSCLMTSPVDTLMDAEESPPTRLPSETRTSKLWDALRPDEPRRREVGEALNSLATFIYEHEVALGALPSRDEASSRPLYDEVQMELVQLRDVLAPRVLEFADDPDLVELLFALEEAERKWRQSLWLIENDWEMDEHYAWRAVAQTFRAAAQIASHISSQTQEPTHTSR